jgi:arsenate reductase (glutaredoxin)
MQTGKLPPMTVCPDRWPGCRHITAATRIWALMSGPTNAGGSPVKSKVTIYHNPRCSKSREMLALLQSKGIEPTVIEYLKTPPSEATLKMLVKQLGIKPRQLLRTKEEQFKAAGLDKAAVTDAQIIAAMVKHPVLIERPIVVANGRAALGRPPEAVLAIL